jgi:hypothetical protein
MDVYFKTNYDDKNIVLLEVNEHILQAIKNGDNNLIIKGDSTTTILSTQSKSYEMKYLETSNTLLLLESEQESLVGPQKILTMNDHVIEANEVCPRRYNIINLLKSKCALNYDITTGSNNIESKSPVNTGLSKYSSHDLFMMSDLCMDDFKKYLLEFNIFEKDGHCYVFHESFLFTLLEDILILISKDNINYTGFSLYDIFSERLPNLVNPDYWNLINSMTGAEKEYVLRHICDVDSTLLSLNIDKVKLLCAKSIFYKKEITFKLYDFIQLLSRTFELVFPIELNNKLVEDSVLYSLSSCDDNLYESYKEYDLRFLNGHCFIFFLKTQRDPLIQYIGY